MYRRVNVLAFFVCALAPLFALLVLLCFSCLRYSRHLASLNCLASLSCLARLSCLELSCFSCRCLACLRCFKRLSTYFRDKIYRYCRDQQSVTSCFVSFFFQSNRVKHNLLRVRMACIVYIYMYLTLPKRLLELRRYLCWET